MRKYFFIFLLTLAVGTVAAQPCVVAHRGYWRTDGSAQNSLASLRRAAEIKCYGSEFDVWMTADGVPVVFHDATIDGIRIEDTTFATLMNNRLSNGEFIPTLQQYLYEALKYPDCKLIFELKSHRTPEREKCAIGKSLELIKMLGLEGRTEYISFSRHACEHIHSQMPDAKVAYLSGDLSPKEVKALGLTGIDYHQKVFEQHPEWLNEAAEEGIEVNVWTVDGEQDLRHHATLKGIDIITTNDPELLLQILSEIPKKG